MITRSEIFARLWIAYVEQNPIIQKVYESFVNIGETVLNDHIALRTFNDPRMNITVLEKPFISAGYIPMGEYTFKEKKLKAKHYEMPNHPEEPKVFISELILEDFSKELQNLVAECINKTDISVYTSNDLIFSGSLWKKPSFNVYERLREESEYAAWLYVYGFRANHFTVSINSLKKLNTIEKVNQHLKEHGFILNTAGGEIKGSKEELLQQSSIMAENIPIGFKEGVYEIPGCYYEFAIRYFDTNGKLYNGFIAKSADKIFESTNYYKKN